MKKIKTTMGEVIELVSAAINVKANVKMPIQLQFKFGAIIKITKDILEAYNEAFNDLQEQLGEETIDQAGNVMMAIPNIKLMDFNRISKAMKEETMTIEFPEFSLKELGANEKNSQSPNKYGIPSSTIFDLWPIITDEDKDKVLEFKKDKKALKIEVPDFKKHFQKEENGVAEKAEATK